MVQSLGAEEPTRIDIADALPWRPSPINYYSDDSADVVAKLKVRLATSELKLKYRETSGYLIDVLKALDVPTESQLLVFSRTSVQQRLISPKNPRALFFNDEVSIGWVPGSPIIEFAAQDPVKGALFYTLSQVPPENAAHDKSLVWKREERCTTCHISSSTIQIPGHMLRSFVVDERGEPQNGYSQITHSTSFDKRWGGWYVTGRADNLIHLGNLFGAEDARKHESDNSFRGALTELSPLVDLKKYPTSHSDLVALLVLEHQTHFYNLVTRVHYEYRLKRYSDAEEQLARYALMEDEAAIPGPLSGSTQFAKLYQSAGSRDSNGRSLRELDLSTRLFRYRLSPLIQSRSFQSLPEEIRLRLFQRFKEARGELIDLDSLD